MLNIDEIFAEPIITTKTIRPTTTAVVNVPVAEKLNAYGAATSEPTITVELQAVVENSTTNATSGVASEGCDAVRNVDPSPCSSCGSAIFWLRPDGSTVCPGCQPKPADAVSKVVIVTLNDGRTELEPFQRRVEPNPFAEWIQRPDVNGKMGWEPPGLPEYMRWWARSSF